VAALSGVFRRVARAVQRASERVRAALVVVLLALVYVLVFPWLAIARRLTPRSRGWKRRDDPELATRERLRRLF
jgi:hypothetical protein